MTDFERARKTMVDNQLRTAAVTDRRLLAAMGEVPREHFVPASRKGLAYIDDAHPISAARKLGAPAPFAKLVQLAAVEHTDRVLDVGCGTGYSSAVLGRLSEAVVAVESDTTLASEARAALAAAGATNVMVIEGSLETGGKAKGPFDVIVVEGVLASPPEGLLAQLKSDGRLVALIGQGNKPAVAHLFVKSGKGIAASAAFDARLPPLSPQGREDSFTF